MDVVLKEPLTDERKRFHVARALLPLGPPIPPFAELKRALGQPDGRVMRGLSQLFARKVQEVLAEQEVTAVLRPTTVRRLPMGLVAGLAAVLLVGLGGTALLAWQVWEQLSNVALPSVLVEAGSPGASERAVPAGLSTQEISRRALPGTVSLRCKDSTGSGFFVGEELVLTNAHVACPIGRYMEVTLPDGRRVMGQTLERDEWLDLATVRVAGAKVEPLPPGDATQLEPGDRLVFIGSPQGLSFTVHEGKVSFVGREYLGLGYVQFDASVNPGNSGGPLLNERGEVVGVVSLKIMNGEGLGLALPIQYAEKLLKLPGTPEGAERWKQLLARVEREEERALQRYRLEPMRPAMVGVEEKAGLGMLVLLVERFPQPPVRVRHRMGLQSDAGSCGMEVEFTHWKPLMQAVDQQQGDARRLKWMVSRGLTEDLYVGAARLPLEGCELSGRGQAWLTVEAGSPELERTPVQLEQVTRARAVGMQGPAGSGTRQMGQLAQVRGEPRKRREWERQQRERQERQAERQWRNAFQSARSHLEMWEQQKRQLQQQDTEGRNVRAQLQQAESAVQRARESLAELEREASLKGIPLGWRR